MLVVTHYCTSTIEQLRTPTFLTSPSARVALCGREMVGGPEHTWCATDVLPSSMLFRTSRPGKLEAPQRPLEVIYLSWVALSSIIHVKLCELINDCSDSAFLATLDKHRIACSTAPIKAILLLQESQKSLLKLQARTLKSSKFFLSDYVPSYITLHSCSPILAPIMSSSGFSRERNSQGQLRHPIPSGRCTAR
jgi:hypothetical protein